MEHFKGVNDQERFNNDMLSELRQIRQLLEHHAQMFEQAKPDRGGKVYGQANTSNRGRKTNNKQ